MTYELLLSSLKAQLSENSQVVLISAVISNAEGIKSWLLDEEAKVVTGTNLNLIVIELKRTEDGGHIPIPEAQDYQIKIREKKQKERTARKTTRDTSLINIYYDGELKFEAVRKADIALCVVKALQDGEELDRETFDLLKNDRGGGFNLIKHLDEVTENEEKYSRYRVNHEPEIIFEDTPYYVLRNWGRASSEKFKVFVEDRFPKVRITFVD